MARISDYELIDSKEIYKQIFNDSPNMICLLKVSGEIVNINATVSKFLNKSRTEIVGRHIFKLGIFSEKDKPFLLERWEELLIEHFLHPLEIELRIHENLTKWVEFQASTIILGEQIYVLTILQDISKRKLSEKEIIESEQKYRELLDSSTMLIVEIDLINKSFSYINTRFLEVLGYNQKEEMFMKSIFKFIFPEDAKKLLLDEEEKEVELRFITKHGLIRWLSGKSRNILDRNGLRVGLRLWLEDISDKKLFETFNNNLTQAFMKFTPNYQKNIALLLSIGQKALKSTLGVYVCEKPMENTSIYTFITSKGEIYTVDKLFFNKNYAISEIFEEKHNHIQLKVDVDQTKFRFNDPFIDKYNISNLYGKLIKSDNSIQVVVCFMYEDNPLIHHVHNNIFYIICTAIEIEQKRWKINQNLEEQNKTLSEVNRFKNELLSRTSHELKTPLISIKGFTELLLTQHNYKLDTDVIFLLEEIQKGSIRLESIINSLLQSSMLDEGHIVLNSTQEDLAFLIRYCVRELSGLVQLRKQKIVLDIEDNLITWFDKERIYEVISNLVLNAIKYTLPGKGIIKIKAERLNQFIKISVIDNGIGIEQENQKKLFTQFGKIERYGQGLEVSIEGSGMGLYIAKKIVELHNGKIWAESEGKNKGSKFSFTIPLI